MPSQPAKAAIPQVRNGIDDNNWTTIIRPRRPWFDISIRELWQYRDLIRLFVRRDFVAQHKQTILGPLWFFIQPLLTTFMFTLIFGRIAKIPTDGVPDLLFYLAGLVCWQYFSLCLIQTSDTFVANAGIFGKVYFPRLSIPISIIISNLFKFGIQFVLFALFLVYFKLKGAPIHLTWVVLLTPVLLILMAVLALGTGILISSLTTKYQDLRHVMAFGVQLWMYATPIVYPLSQVPEHLRNYFALNPMTAIVETFKLGFLGVSSIRPEQLIIGTVSTFVILIIGLMLFSRVEKTFMDTV